MAASRQDLGHALAHDKSNLSHGLKNLEAKGLVTITRMPDGRA
jgi:DNA-binding MarR family transcriptional regulator